jgi:trigger factor
VKIEKQAQENCTLTLTIEVEDERVLPALRQAAARLSKNYRIPGFRPGKAPLETVMRVLGEGAVYNEALEKLGQEVYQQALEQEAIDAYAPGELENIEQLKPLVLKFSVPLRPEVELGDYRESLRVPYTAPQVDDAQVEEVLERLRERQAEMAPVERPAQAGDVATLDAKGFLNEGQNPSDFLLADENVELVLDEKADWPMPGFAPHVVGLAAGESRKFDLAFPDDYANTSLRGQVAHFDVTVKEIKSRTLPEWTDELAKSLGDYESLEALRASVREQLVRQAERSTSRDYGEQVMSQLLTTAQIKYPPSLLEQETDSYLEDLDQRLHEQRLTLDDYLKIEKKTREEYREEIRPKAEERLKRTLILGKIVDREGLRVDGATIADRIESMSAPWGEQAAQVRESLDTDRGRQMIALDVLSDAAMERLMAIARGEAVPELPAAEAPAAPAAETPAEATAEAEPAPAETALTAQPASEPAAEPGSDEPLNPPAGE